MPGGYFDEQPGGAPEERTSYNSKLPFYILIHWYSIKARRIYGNPTGISRGALMAIDIGEIFE
jgi:hypothetical protein